MTDADDEQYTDIDVPDAWPVPDAIEDTEQYIDSDSENQIGEALEETDTTNTIQDSEILGSEDIPPLGKKVPSVKSDVIRSTRLPIARIKNIMKMDPDVNMINSDAVFLVTKATEMFLETMAKETYAFTSTTKRKTISKKDLDTTINMVDCLCFLEGALDF